MRVRTKFAIVILIITLVLSGVVGGSLELFKRQAIQDTQQEVNETVDLTAQQIDTAVGERRDFIGLVASQPAARDFDRSRRILLGVTRDSRFVAAQLIHRNGTVIDVRGGISEEARQELIGNETNASYARAALEGRTYVGDPQANGERFLVVISAPILYTNGTVKGALAAAIPVNKLTFFQGIRPLETDAQTVRVTSADGAVLDESEETFEASITAEATVQSTGWRVTIQRDRSDLTERLQTFALVQGISLFFVLSTIVGFGVWEYRTNLSQTERLLEGFAAIKRGDYDYSLDLASGEEWIQISEGFDDLSTGLAEREAALREREQRLDVLNRVLRHNLRNEMSIILNYADIVSDFTDDPQLETAAETILGAGRDLISLSDKARQVRNAFDDADRLVRFGADELIEDAVEPVVEDYPDVAVTHERADDPDLAVAGIPAVGTALENLVENACEHNDADDPAVEVYAEAGDDTVRLVVEDNGPGIPEHEYEVLTAGEETALEHGSGLGLWVAFWIVDRSEGRLAFEENDPRGTVATVELPTPAAAGIPPGEESVELGGLSIAGDGAPDDAEDESESGGETDEEGVDETEAATPERPGED